MALVLAVPFGARAGTDECPRLAPVYAEIGANAEILKPRELGDAIAKTIGSNEGLSEIVTDLRSRYFDATDPKLANALMATYCLHRQGENLSQKDVDKKLTAFEDDAYGAVYPDAIGESKKEGWLYSDS